MRPARSHSPQPLPLPPPPLSTVLPCRRRHRDSSCSSSSFSSSVDSSSPDHAMSAMSMTSVVVPFSWERHPGIPKSSLSALMVSPSSSAPLPLPPPRPSTRHRVRRRRAEDPFVAAFVECTRPGEEEDGRVYSAGSSQSTIPGRAGGRPWWTGAGGLLDLYGCKSAVAVADGALLDCRRPTIPDRR